ncbi:ABC transporter permease [Acidicapsa dinghuensis]|uniref:ABC transporter permease n=1 Tax=Acidicapsa dinghuensis TaxID=2218256 RepID=A0ABW1EMU1_9BACT|nr:ABC transporter permease [Acidicapsa dinghuensis]
MGSLVQDLRYAWRQLRKSPGFAATAVISLALGIGATTAVFSVIWGVLMDPFPYRDAQRMFHLAVLDSAGVQRAGLLTPSQLKTILQSPVLERAAVSDDWRTTVTGRDFPEDIHGTYFSTNAFDYYGVPMALGRGFVTQDAPEGHDPQPVTVLGYKFWMARYGGDPSVLGKTIELAHVPYTIVGVASSRFTWDDADVYLPIKYVTSVDRTYYANYRLRAGVTFGQAASALQPLLEQFAKETPTHFPLGGFRVDLIGINDYYLRRMGGTLYLLFAGVGLLLLIGCGNVSILLLARGTARSREFAVRAAVGASRRRMVGQLLIESSLLAVSGAGLGVALAFVLLRKIVENLPPDSFPHEAAIGINVPVLCFCTAIALLTGVLFGLWPALKLSRPELSSVMQAGSRKLAGNVEGRRSLNSLIAAQIALTLLLLAGAGAALEGFVKMAHVRLGYDPHNVLSVLIPLREGTYNTWAERSNYFEQMRAAVARVPGVTEVAISTNATPPANGENARFEILGKPSNQEQTLQINFVSQEYFPVLRIPLAQGRVWDATENRNGAAVVVVNETLARKYFPGGDALGGSIKLPEMRESLPYNPASPALRGWLRIIGVIPDKLNDGLDKPVKPEAFIPDTVYMRMGTQILVRSAVSPMTLLNAIRKEVSKVNADQQIGSTVRDLDHWITNEPEWARGVLISWLFGAFAVLALLLAAVGLYSVVSYSVAQRTNEFGVRMALGAQREHIWRIAMRSASVSVVAGVCAGAVLALALDRIVAAHWAEVNSRDPLLLIGSAAVLLMAAMLACMLPARRAAKVDPVVALRYE